MCARVPIPMSSCDRQVVTIVATIAPHHTLICWMNVPKSRTRYHPEACSICPLKISRVIRRRRVTKAHSKNCRTRRWLLIPSFPFHHRSVWLPLHAAAPIVNPPMLCRPAASAVVIFGAVHAIVKSDSPKLQVSQRMQLHFYLVS